MVETAEGQNGFELPLREDSVQACPEIGRDSDTIRTKKNLHADSGFLEKGEDG